MLLFESIVSRTMTSRALIPRAISGRRRQPSTAVLRAFFVVFAAFLACGGISRAKNQDLPSKVSNPAVPSTVDDFDGDFHPDQIAVQTGANEFSGTQYWIEVRLSTAGRQLIPIFSVPGGIQVVARDVNGNGYLDLVLTASSLRRPVAILLNDGHGQFTRVDPGEFPRAFQDSDTNWETRAHVLDDIGGLPRSLRFLIVLASGELWIAPSPVARQTAENSTGLVGRALAPHAGRAPPVSSLL